MASFTLDDIRAAAEKKYGSLDIQLADGSVCKLVNALRLPKERRDALTKIGERLEQEDVDQAEVFAEALREASNGSFQADKLISEVNGDLAVLAEIFEQYSKGTQAGEASASQS